MGMISKNAKEYFGSKLMELCQINDIKYEFASGLLKLTNVERTFCP